VSGYAHAEALEALLALAAGAAVAADVLRVRLRRQSRATSVTLMVGSRGAPADARW
jgi:hypothetical protein